MKIGFALAAATVCASALVLAQAPAAQPPSTPPKPAPGATPAGFDGSAYVKARDIPARIITFSVEPASIRAGQPSMLVWHTENPTSVTIDPEPGRVTPRGSRRLTPAVTTTYTLTVRGPNDQVLTKTVTVTVAGTVPAASTGARKADSSARFASPETSTLSACSPVRATEPDAATDELAPLARKVSTLATPPAISMRVGSV